MANPKEEVWVLVIDSACGTIARAFRSKDAATKALGEYVRDRWPAVGDHDRYTPEKFSELPDREGAEVYFGSAGGDEWFVLEAITVEG